MIRPRIAACAMGPGIQPEPLPRALLAAAVVAAGMGIGYVTAAATELVVAAGMGIGYVTA